MIKSAIWYGIDGYLFATVDHRTSIIIDATEKLSHIGKEFIAMNDSFPEMVAESKSIEVLPEQFIIQKEVGNIIVNEKVVYKTRVPKSIKDSFMLAKEIPPNMIDLTVPYHTAVSSGPGYESYLYSTRSVCHIFPMANNLSVVVVGSSHHLEFMNIEHNYDETHLSIGRLASVISNTTEVKTFKISQLNQSTGARLLLEHNDNKTRINLICDKVDNKFAESVKSIYLSIIEGKIPRTEILRIDPATYQNISRILSKQTAKMLFKPSGEISVVQYNREEPLYMKAKFSPVTDFSIRGAVLFKYKISTKKEAEDIIIYNTEQGYMIADVQGKMVIIPKK